MRAEASGRAVRIAGLTLAPGEARAVLLPLPGQAKPENALPVWVVVGRRPGPRVTVVAALRGFEAAAAQGAQLLAAGIDPGAIAGSLLVVPVLRPGGRFAARAASGRGPAAAATSSLWTFPGDAGGRRRLREAFLVFSEVCVGSSLLLVLTTPKPHRQGALLARGDLGDPRVRRLALQAGAAGAVHARWRPGALAAAATEMGIPTLELGAGSGRQDEGTAQTLAGAARAVLAATGALAPGPEEAAASQARPPVFDRLTVVRAPIGGILRRRAEAGDLVSRGEPLARIAPVLANGDGRSVEITAPTSALVVEAAEPTGVRAGTTLFLLGRVRRSLVARRQRQQRRSDGANGAGTTEKAVKTAPGPLRIGWVERVSLPTLGVRRLRAKIDTGARTSALHVARMRAVGTTSGPQHRPILEVTLPGNSRRGARPVAVRVPVREYLLVKDTSGRTERRPVIETTLRLGTLERRIRITLTNRGDMLFPMLIGRTALGPGVVVDPSRRLLLREQDN
jgi:predicted deacylase